MEKSTTPFSHLSRRSILAASGGIGAVSVAGCLESSRPEGNAPDSIDRPMLGEDNGDVPVLMVFEDYGCPACAEFNDTMLPRIIEDYVETGRLKIAHYDYPIPVRQLSDAAAQSGWVVQSLDSDSFWDYKKILFDNQGSLGYELFEQAADELGLDGATVVSETKSRAYEKFVRDDKQLGNEKGVQGTPSLFIGDAPVPAGPYNAIVNELEQQLQSR